MKRIALVTVLAAALGVTLATANPFLPNPPMPGGGGHYNAPPATYIYDAHGNIVGFQGVNGVDNYFVTAGGSNSFAPTRLSGFGGASAVVTGSSMSAFSVSVSGVAAASGVLTTQDTAANGWACQGTDITNPAVVVTEEVANTVSSVTFNAYTTSGVASTWATNDKINFQCAPY